jgi:NADPH2 dehydrogenase
MRIYVEDAGNMAPMHNLFSPISLGKVRLPNRIVLTAAPSGYAAPGGFVDAALAQYYILRAQGGVGLLVFEHTHVLPPSDSSIPHVGLYGDAQIAALHLCIAEIRHHQTNVMVMLDHPQPADALSTNELLDIGEAFITAAWRAHAAQAQGVMLSTADGGIFEHLVSPLRNQRTDQHGGSLANRLRLLLGVIEGIHRWLGERFVIGVRINVEEFAPGGITLQDARVITKRLIGAGVKLIEVTAVSNSGAPIAHFPGWQVPLASGIKSISEVPVLVGGLSDDELLADSVIHDGSADLISATEILRVHPTWPIHAQQLIARLNSPRSNISNL